MAAEVQEINRTGIWRRSSRCNPGKNCVEVGRADTGVLIRDSKGGSTLRALDAAQWTAFLSHCRTPR